MILIFSCTGGGSNSKKKEAHHRGNNDYLCDFFFFFLMFSVWLFVRVKRNDMTKIRTCALVNGDSVLNKIPFSPR